MSIIHPLALKLVRNPEGMTADETRMVLDFLMAEGISTAEGAELLAAWAQRGETAVELAAVVEGLLARATAIPLSGPCMDLCGTGGSGLTRFNVSTTATFILAAAGVPMAKHGNRGSARANGSFDLLDALTVPFQLAPAQLARLREHTGVCFLFARTMHPAVAAVAPMRKLAGRRTIFNLAGPLANPCRPTKQIIGVVDERTALVMAEALRLLGASRTIHGSDVRAVVVRGHPGIDEISISGPSHVWDVHDGHVHHAIIERIHQHGVHHDQLPGGDAAVNAELFEKLLTGKERGPLLDMVCANAGTALDCWFNRPILSDGTGFNQARELVANGKAWAAYGRHRAMAQALAATG